MTAEQIATEKPEYSFDQALAVLKAACAAKEYNPGWIANTLLEIYDEADLTIEQWLAIADATSKPKAWAYSRAEENGSL
ncbi:hypothetical protein ACQ4M3_01245 [Leptolyngbya sp. AN03gr2]|uniref:hypothetical protein n=1 Tax=unclassified Leptolyngbya TaxID=2650499 RepID=UPI003D321ABB